MIGARYHSFLGTPDIPEFRAPVVATTRQKVGPVRVDIEVSETLYQQRLKQFEQHKFNIFEKWIIKEITTTLELIVLSHQLTSYFFTSYWPTVGSRISAITVRVNKFIT